VGWYYTYKELVRQRKDVYASMSGGEEREGEDGEGGGRRLDLQLKPKL